MKKESHFERTEIAWAAHKALYAPGLIAKVRSAISADLPSGGLAHLLEAFDGPSRATRSTTKSSAGKYTSKKMGVTVGYDSSTIELPTAMALERSPDVVAYLDQSPAICISYQSRGRKRSYHHRPDFVVIYRDRIVLLECKRAAALAARAEADPELYVLSPEGRWMCPPGQEAAAKLGMDYVLWTDADFGPEMIRNLRYLNSFVSAERNPAVRPPDEIQDYLGSRGRATISAVLEDLGSSVCIDDVLSAISRNEVAFDLASAPLDSRDLCWLYRDPETMAAFGQLRASDSGLDVEVKGAASVQLRAGDAVMWHGQEWQCASISGSVVTLLQGGMPTTIRVPVLLKLIDTGEMSLAGRPKDDGYERASARLLSASPGEMAIAVDHLKQIKPHFDGSAAIRPNRTLRRYLQKFRSAEREYGKGLGLVGLLPETKACGNRTPRHLEAVLTLADANISEYILTADNVNRKAAYKLLRGACTAQSLAPPSYAWFCKRIADRPKFETALARKGRKGAYLLEPRTWVEGQTTADYAFQVAHVDHTLLDLAVLFGIDGLEATKVWLTVMLCASSRRVLAHAISFDPPSSRSVVIVMRECVRRHHRLPERIIADGGSEFGSIWMETVCAFYDVIIQRRPKSKPRAGSEGERFFGTTTTQVINFMTGNTQLTKNVRALSREVDPFKRATATAAYVNTQLKDYFYEAYDNSCHTTLLCSPRQSFESSMASAGERASRFIRFDQLFLVLTAGTTKKGKAKVQADGVKINYLYYSAPELRAHLGKSVHVRFDQFDLSNAWAFVGNRWVKLVSRYASVLTRFCERDIGVVTEVRRKSRSLAERKALTEPAMIKFLENLARQEGDMLSRRLALEERALRQDQSMQFDDTEIVEEVRDPEPSEPSRKATAKPDRSQLSVNHFVAVEEL